MPISIFIAFLLEGGWCDFMLALSRNIPMKDFGPLEKHVVKAFDFKATTEKVGLSKVSGVGALKLWLKGIKS